MHGDHPDLPGEQAYVARAWQYLDRGLADAERNYLDHGASSRATQQAMRRALRILRDARGDDHQLVYGRMDLDGETFYVGRRGVHDENHDRVVVSWHAPIASAYLEATPADTRGLDLKRVFVEQDRTLQRIFDEIAAQAADGQAAATTSPSVSDALLAELERSRDGAMRDVVATIQSEQFRIIRASSLQPLVVQGGPGTGKTVVGLHRAVWLAFNHPEIRSAGILVVAPNSAFLSYVSGVLPSLDAGDLHQADVASLYTGDASVAGSDDAETSLVKGSRRMAAVLGAALSGRVGWEEGDLQLAVGADRIGVPADEIRALLADVRSRSLSHADGRDVMRNGLAALAYQQYTDQLHDAGRSVIASEATIRRLATFTNALDRMWPALTPEELLRGLFGTQSWLLHATANVLTADERARLYRAPEAAIADEPWTRDDLFCLDELAHLIYGGTASYGHVVIDEAQDLSPMQARALSRRCPSGSFTVLGDLAQASGAWIRDTWSELTDDLSALEWAIEGLSIGYRVPAAVLDLAARQLPLIAPGLAAPRSIRVGRGEPAVVAATEARLVAGAFELAQDYAAEGLKTAIVVADGRFDGVMAAAGPAAVDLGDGRDGDFALPLTLVPASLSKGLEFDAVVLVEPADIVASGAQGRRLLYIAMTRPTQILTLVHSRPLPSGLEHLAPSAAGGPAETGASGRSARQAALGELLKVLTPADLDLVEALVRRLAPPAAADVAVEHERPDERLQPVGELSDATDRLTPAPKAAVQFVVTQPQIAKVAVSHVERMFGRAMADTYRRAKDEAGYTATYFLRMLTDHGPVETARRLIASDQPSDGFTTLWERNRLDLSVEATVLRPEFAVLFTEDERDACRRRLALYGVATD